jgi:hypothetical protein
MLKGKDDGLSKAWVVSRRAGAAYTGGQVSPFPDGRRAACLCSDRVAILDLDTGLVERFIPSDPRVSAARRRRRDGGLRARERASRNSCIPSCAFSSPFPLPLPVPPPAGRRL